MEADDLLPRLRQRIESREAQVGVIGLGYVGTAVAGAFAKCGFEVTAVDVVAEKVAAVSVGRPPFEGHEPELEAILKVANDSDLLHATTDYDDLRSVEILLVAVETPVDPESRRPGYKALRSALDALGPRLSAGRLVIVESTLAPGTTDRVVVPALEAASGLKTGAELLVAHCPERVMPGRLLSNLRHMSRVVGGTSREAAAAAVALYRCVVDADLDATDALTAEIVKAGENAYRDVQIAFANEMALLCEDLGADVWRVRELLNKSPGRNMLLPGAGVGGHCIPKDPWLLIANAGPEFHPRLIPAAREVNDAMPGHVIHLLEESLAFEDVGLDGASVAVLGYAYLADSDDDRNSPSAELVRLLEERGAGVRIHDPWIDRYSGAPVADVVAGADAVVLMVSHSAYEHLDWAALHASASRPIVVDGRRSVDRALAEGAGWTVRTIGVG